ncbi:MAG: hypothetical protein IAE84_17310 [Saprospiraceae bacterium]|nr:hypothetical protein [Saprospiraceae bacterium]
MIIVNCETAHEKVHCFEKEIILNGPPSQLRGHITLSNTVAEFMLVQELPMKQYGKEMPLQAGLSLNMPLSPGENRRQSLCMTLPADTAPGTYRQKVEVGGEEKNLTMIVQETLEIELIPESLLFVGIAPGMSHTKEVLLANKGNVPFSVPVLRHNMSLDMDLVCRNLSKALKETPDGDSKATLDAFFKGLKTDMADWIEVRIKEAGTVVAPGESVVLHITFILPKDIHPNREYEGDLRILDQLLSYMLIPGPKNDVVKKTTQV